MDLYDGKNYMQVGNCIVERDAYAIAERIKEYDPDLDLVCLDPSEVKLTSAPFMVVCRMPDGSYQKVLEAWELDQRILERIWAADQHRVDTLVTLEQWEARNAKLATDRYQEHQDSNHEMLMAALKNQKSSFSFKNQQGDLVTVNDEGPVTRNNAKKSF